MKPYIFLSIDLLTIWEDQETLPSAHRHPSADPSVVYRDLGLGTKEAEEKRDDSCLAKNDRHVPTRMVALPT